MFSHILVPINRVKDVKNALEIAADMCADSDGKITLIHVVELIQDMPKENFTEFYGKLESQAKQDLKPAIDIYERQGLVVEHEVLFGKRVKEILDFSQKQKVDLIVLQSHPVNLSDPTTGWGTISYRVAVLAQCPVMLVK